MAYRKVETNIWKDPWFLDLSPYGKLLFLYFCTNDSCNQCGCYQISLKVVSFETGLTLEQVEKVLPELEPKVKYFEKEQIVLILNFTRYQANNKEFWKSAYNKIQEYPEHIRNLWLWHNRLYLQKYLGVEPPSNPPSTELQQGFVSTEQNRNSNRTEY